MTFPSYRLTMAAAAAGLAIHASAQSTSTETPLTFPGQPAPAEAPAAPPAEVSIPRAMPVEEPAPATSEPAGQETPLSLPTAPPEGGTAEPEPPAPAPAPTVRTPAAEPPRPAAPRPTAPEPPRSGPDVDQFNEANKLYSIRDFTAAAVMYEDYLRTWPNGHDAAVVWFRMGECFLNVRDYRKAEYCYDQLIRRFQTGEMVSSAAYRLGNFRYSVGKYDAAADYFKRARLNAKNADVVQAAAYYEARSLVFMGLKTQAMENFARIAENTEGKKEYREAALRELGKIQFEKGDTEGALQTFLKVISETNDPEIMAESLYNAGTISNEHKQGETALRYFEQLLKLPGVEPWKNRARASVVQANFIKGDYDAVISSYSQASGVIPAEQQAPITLLTVGNAYRMKGMTTRAIEVYRTVERAYPESHEALESAYYKLLCFFQEANSKLPEFVDAYIKYYKPRFPDDALLDRAILLKAEYLFTTSQNPAQFADAAGAYGQIDPARLPEDQRGPLLFKRGWTEGLAGAAAMSVTTLSRYLIQYPGDSNVPLALMRRGVSRVEQFDYPNAIKDFSQIITQYPKSESAAAALQQSGLVRAQMRDWDGALKDFRALLEQYPDSSAKIEATYWIGKSLYEKQSYKEAVPPLWEVLEADPENFAEDAGLCIILSHYYGEDADSLADDIDKITRQHPGVPVPPKVLWWLGMKQYQAGKYQAAARFLGLGANPKEADATHPQVWLHLGLARMELGWFKSAIVAANAFLKTNNLPDNNAEGYLLLADANRELHHFDAAETAIRSGLDIAKPGRVRAQLEMQRALCLFARADLAKGKGGDAEATENFEKAARQFASISQTFIDQNIQPEAIRLAAESFERAGNASEASKLRSDLKANHPYFVPKPARTVTPEPELLQKQADDVADSSNKPGEDKTAPAEAPETTPTPDENPPTTADSEATAPPAEEPDTAGSTEEAEPDMAEAPAPEENSEPESQPAEITPLEIRELEIVPRAMPAPPEVP